MRHVIFALTAALIVAGCSNVEASTSAFEPKPYVQTTPPEWTKDAVIYQLNTRQFSKDGTFKAAQKQLPRLAEMGVDIVWLMPIHPIGEKDRKGTLGSPYAVKDYRAINPDLGTEAEFRAFVDKAHELGMKVILDWVANHSAWDNPLTKAHPEWYTKTPEGGFMPPEGTDWFDVADLNYDQPGLRQYMTESLEYWVREFDIDGYRADVAGMVPTDFWETARARLEAIKPVFMLAEWQERDLHARAFDATYAWGWKEAMQKLVKDGSGAGAIRGYYTAQKTGWPHEAYRMVYTDNHDQNSWDGVASQIYGPAYEAAIALSFTGQGIPLIYNGQEADLDRQLKFFEKDEIAWKKGRYDDLFRKLIALKTKEKALWNGGFGASMVEVPTSASKDVYAFIRGSGKERVFAVFNLTPRATSITFDLARHYGAFTDAMMGDAVTFDKDSKIELGAWGYRIFTAKD